MTTEPSIIPEEIEINPEEDVTNPEKETGPTPDRKAN